MVMLQRSVVRKGLPVSVKKGKGLSLDLLLNFKWSKWTALVCDTGLVKNGKGITLQALILVLILSSH